MLYADFVREFPLVWNDRRYLFDFGFARERTILETNGPRWHDDSTDYEHDNEKWSVPGRHGYRLVFATWEKVTRHPGALLAELTTTLAASRREPTREPVVGVRIGEYRLAPCRRHASWWSYGFTG